MKAKPLKCSPERYARERKCFLPWMPKNSPRMWHSCSQGCLGPGRTWIWIPHSIRAASYLLPLQEGWTRWPTEVPSNPDHSVILWFCDLSSPLCCGEVLFCAYKWVVSQTTGQVSTLGAEGGSPPGPSLELRPVTTIMVAVGSHSGINHPDSLHGLNSTWRCFRQNSVG